jgi:3-mercaptopyruvate sulfurtransferase SseA
VVVVVGGGGGGFDETMAWWSISKTGLGDARRALDGGKQRWKANEARRTRAKTFVADEDVGNRVVD